MRTGTWLEPEALDHLDCLLNFRDLGGHALMRAEKLSLGEAISVVLLIQLAEDGIGSLLADRFHIFLNGAKDTRKIALGMRF
jgi:hypothetical protein